MLCDTWLGGFFNVDPASFWHSYERHDRYFRSRGVFCFLNNKKYFFCDFCGRGGVYGRGLSSDKQPVYAACKGASKSSLMKKSIAGKQEKNTKHLQPLTLGNSVCVSETTAWSAAWKGCLGLSSAIWFWHLAMIGVNGGPLYASEGTVWPFLLVFTHYIFVLWHLWAWSISTAHSL